MPLNAKAVAAADRLFYQKHPERVGRPLTRNPEDEDLRREWWNNYNQAAAPNAAPISPQPSADTVDAAATSCPASQPPPPRRFLCIRSNVASGSGDPGLTAGHSMLSLHENGNVKTYGAWPDSHPAIQAAGLDNAGGSDIRSDFKLDDVSRYPYAHCRELTEAEYKKFNEELTQPFQWGYFNNCANFSSQTFEATTGEKVRAGDLFGIRTPRAVGKYILEENQGKESNLAELQASASPQGAEAEPGGGSSSSY